MNQLLGSLALWPIEQLLNQLLKADPHVARRLSVFDDKIIEIAAVTPTLNLLIMISAGRVKLSPLDSDTLVIEPDARISGAALDLLELLTTPGSGRALANPALTISGDAQLIQDIYHSIHSLDLDWSDLLAPFLGDIVSHGAERAVDETRQWANEAGLNLRHGVNDYIKEETELFPHPEQINEFESSLDQLRLRIDRLQARSQALLTSLD